MMLISRVSSFEDVIGDMMVEVEGNDSQLYTEFDRSINFELADEEINKLSVMQCI